MNVLQKKAETIEEEVHKEEHQAETIMDDCQPKVNVRKIICK